jgi:predicted transcriptional regulator
MCVELIKNLVESEFNLKLKIKTRRREYVEARAMYYMLLRDKGKMTVCAIAKTLDKNHATVLHSLKGLRNWMSYDTNMKSIYDSLEKKVDNIIKLHPELFNVVVTEEEFYVLAYKEIENKSKLHYKELEDKYKSHYKELEDKNRKLRGRYSFLLHKLKHTSPKTYETFKQLETNDI